MILLVFLNEHDKQSKVLGKSLPDHLTGDHIKIYTRYADSSYEVCETVNTLPKIKEYAQVFDQVVVSFGLRLFPPTAYKEIVSSHKNVQRSIVFLKQLKGSKTWTISNNKISYDNYRVADCGLFILTAKDLKSTNTNNFNTFLKELIANDKLDYQLVPYWLMSNYISDNNKKKTKNYKRGD